MKYKGVFFDLDGTLLSLDLDNFLNKYFGALTTKVAPFVEPKTFMKALLESTELMLYNDGSKTNELAFMDGFFQRLDNEPQQLLPLFQDFYLNEFKDLGKDIQPVPEALRAVELAESGGAQVILATNPVFPRAAVDARLEWAGLASFPFGHVTSYENSSFCKPNPRYFAEILEATGLRGEDCLMVGNDSKEDLVAAELGFDTFLLLDNLIDRDSPYKPTWKGSWQDLLKVLGQDG